MASSQPQPLHTNNSTSRRQLAFVLDIDGCLSREGVPIPGTPSALHKLESTHTPFVVCTNGGGQLESTRAQKLNRTFQTNISPDQVILSHTPLRTEVVPRLKDSRVLIVGEHCGEVARAYGLTKAEDVREYGRRHPTLFPRRRDVEPPMEMENGEDPVKAVLFFEDAEDLGEALQLVLDVLLTNGNPPGPRVLLEEEDAKQEVEVWYTNPDLVYSGAACHPRLTQGSFRLCLETLFDSATSYSSTSYYSIHESSSKSTRNGRTLVSNTVGKPTPLTGKTALSKLLSQCPPGTTENDLEIWTVGDNPFSDVALAHTMGWNSALVRSGIWNGEVSQLEKDGIRPTKIVDTVSVLIEDMLHA